MHGCGRLKIEPPLFNSCTQRLGEYFKMKMWHRKMSPLTSKCQTGQDDWATMGEMFVFSWLHHLLYIPLTTVLYECIVRTKLYGEWLWGNWMRPAVRWWDCEFVRLIRWGRLCHPPRHKLLVSHRINNLTRLAHLYGPPLYWGHSGQERVTPDPADTEEGVCRAAVGQGRTLSGG